MINGVDSANNLSGIAQQLKNNRYQFVLWGILCVCLLSACAKNGLNDALKDNSISNQSASVQKVSDVTEWKELYYRLFIILWRTSMWTNE